MRGVFDADRPRREIGDIALEHDVAHELVEEGGHLETVELAEQRRVVEAHPPDRPLLHRLLERGLRHRRPAVGRIVDLDEQIVRRQVGVVDPIRRADVVDREPFFRCRLLQPAQRGVGEGLMNRLARFGQGDDSARGLRLLRDKGWRGRKGYRDDADRQ